MRCNTSNGKFGIAAIRKAWVLPVAVILLPIPMHLMALAHNMAVRQRLLQRAHTRIRNWRVRKYQPPQLP